MIRIGDPYDFAKAVRTRRRALGLTQRELALAAGLGRVSVLRLENEPEKCQLRTALRVASVLKLNLSVTGAGGGVETEAALFEGRDGGGEMIEARVEPARLYSD